MARRKRSDKEFIKLIQEIDMERFRESVKEGRICRFSRSSNGQSLYLSNVVSVLSDLIWLFGSGYLAGCNTIDDIAYFAELRTTWFTSVTGTESVPSYDTLCWFLTRVKPEAFKALPIQWFERLDLDMRNQLLVIDGKRLCAVSDNEQITHIVALFAAEN